MLTPLISFYIPFLLTLLNRSARPKPISFPFLFSNRRKTLQRNYSHIRLQRRESEGVNKWQVAKREHAFIYLIFESDLLIIHSSYLFCKYMKDFFKKMFPRVILLFSAWINIDYLWGDLRSEEEWKESYLKTANSSSSVMNKDYNCVSRRLRPRRQEEKEVNQSWEPSYRFFFFSSYSGYFSSSFIAIKCSCREI